MLNIIFSISVTPLVGVFSNVGDNCSLTINLCGIADEKVTQPTQLRPI